MALLAPKGGSGAPVRQDDIRCRVLGIRISMSLCIGVPCSGKEMLSNRSARSQCNTVGDQFLFFLATDLQPRKEHGIGNMERS